MTRYNETNYFKEHAELDEAHEKMGEELLLGLATSEYRELLLIQEQAWDVLNLACNRIYELSSSFEPTKEPV